MAIIAKSSGEGTSFEPAPSGVHVREVEAM